MGAIKIESHGTQNHFFERDQFKINVVQCRPLQVQGGGGSVTTPDDIPEERMVVEATGAVVGPSMYLDIDWFVYVHPETYAELPSNDRYEIANVIGEVLQHRDIVNTTIMLLGPGRWGTTTPSLGVPAKFAQITPVTVLCEIVAMRETLIPDVSLGTHFFNEMVENNMLYLALFPNAAENSLNEQFFRNRLPNRLCEFAPDACDWMNHIQVVSTEDLGDEAIVRLAADTHKQRVVCYITEEES